MVESKPETGSEVEIRLYKPGDYSEIKRLLEESGLFYGDLDSEEHLTKITRRDRESILVAIENNRVVGTVSIEDGRIPLIFRLAVATERRNQGIGSELMEIAEKILQSRGCKEVGILVDEADSELQLYYEKRGWEKGHTYVWMAKELEPLPEAPPHEVHDYEVLNDKGEVIGYSDTPWPKKEE